MGDLIRNAWDEKKQTVVQGEAKQGAAYDEMGWAPVDEAAAMMGVCEEMVMLLRPRQNDKWKRQFLEEHARSIAGFDNEVLGMTVGAEQAVCLPPGLDIAVGVPPGLEIHAGSKAPRQLLPPPGIHCPYMLPMPTLLESWMEPEACNSEAALALGSPMKVLAVDVAAPERKGKGFPRHRRSSSVSANIDLEDDGAVDSDSDAQEHDTRVSYRPSLQQGPAYVATAR